MKRFPRVHVSGLVGVLLVALIAGGVYYEKTHPRTIKEVVLQANLKQVGQEEINAVLEPYRQASFWFLDIQQIQADLKRLDWVSDAQVTRSWPDQLKLHIQEQVPVARWQASGLVNQLGEVFFPAQQQGFEHLVQIDGQLQDSKRLLHLLSRLQKQLDGMQWVIAQLSLQASGVIELNIHEGPKLILASKKARFQLQRFVRAYPHMIESLRKSAQVIDLRYSNGFAVKPNSGLSVQQN